MSRHLGMFRLLSGGLFAAGISPAMAINTDPGDFIALPPGSNLSVLYYDHNTSSEQFAAGHQVASSSIKADIAITRFVHYIDLGGITASPQVLLPAASVSVDSGSASPSTSGVGDPILAMPFWLVNRPESRTYFAIAPYLTLPLGQYNRKDPLNVGENRWKFTLQPGYSQGLGKDWTFDLIADVQFHGDNGDVAGGGTLKQKLLYSVQPQITYHAGEGFNLSLGMYHYWGGETRLRGVDQNDKVRTTSLLGTLAYWVSKRDNLQFQYRADTDVENGAKYNGLQFRFLHLF